MLYVTGCSNVEGSLWWLVMGDWAEDAFTCCGSAGTITIQLCRQI